MSSSTKDFTESFFYSNDLQKKSVQRSDYSTSDSDIISEIFLLKENPKFTSITCPFSKCRILFDNRKLLEEHLKTSHSNFEDDD